METLIPKKYSSKKQKNLKWKYLLFFKCIVFCGKYTNCYSNIVSLLPHFFLFQHCCLCLYFWSFTFILILGNCQNEKCFRNEILAREKYLKSRNSIYKLYLRRNGNLVLTCQERPIWTSFTSNNTVDFLYFDEEGISLIIRGKDKNTVWRAHSTGLGKELVLQDDGKLVLYNSCNTRVWEIGDNKKCREGLFSLFNTEFFRPKRLLTCLQYYFWE